LKFTQYERAGDLLLEIGSYLEEREVENNLPLGVLKQLHREEKEKKQSTAFIAEARKDNKPCAVLIQTPPRKMIVCGKTEAMREAAEWLFFLSKTVPGVVGCESTAEAFAKAWTEISGKEAVLVKEQFIYKLERVDEFEQPPGKLTYASEDDTALVMAWTEDFVMGSLREEDMKKLEETVLDQIRRNEVYLWRDEDHVPVSMAKRTRELTNGVVVNYVYTPEEYENQGFATACVGAMAGRLLDEGFEFCSVNTDIENEASKNVYQKLGFVRIGRSLEFDFK
jgi:uncharacterized protein